MSGTGLDVPQKWRERRLEPRLPQGFDPLDPSNDDAKLYEAGLPPRPDAMAAPIARRVWTKIMEQRKFQSAAFVKFLPTSSEMLPPVGTHFESSRNWSGGRIAPIGGRRFKVVVGCWTVPSLTPIGSPPAGGLPRRCSIWIGFGAHRRWSHALPQLGTVHTEGSPDEHVPFIQWWIKGDPSSGQIILAFPGTLNPGDRICSLLWLMSPTVMVYFLMRTAPLPSIPIIGYLDMLAPTSPHPKAATEGVSAEWIVERPRDPTTKLLHPLPNFGTVGFFDGAAWNAVGTERKLSAARLPRMMDRLGSPEHTRCIAVSRRRGKPRGCVDITYR